MTEDQISREAAESVDPRRIYRVYESWPRRATESLGRRVRGVEGTFERVAFFGMGGSAAAGDILSDWLLACGRTELSVFKGVSPNARLERSLVMVCSASGETEETLTLAERAARGGGTLVTISSGGRLEEFAKKMGIRHLRVDIPVAPRFALPNMLFTALAVLRGAGLLDGLQRELEDALASMEKTGAKIAISVPSPGNPAKKLALRLAGATPKIYASSLTRGVAVRFKNSLNENAKMHAFADSSPELFHNEVESWEEGGERFVPVFVRHRQEPRREGERLQRFVELLRETKDPLEVRGMGKTRLGRLVSLCYQLDFATYYTAILRRVDPYVIRTINRLKSG